MVMNEERMPEKKPQNHTHIVNILQIRTMLEINPEYIHTLSTAVIRSVPVSDSHVCRWLVLSQPISKCLSVPTTRV